MAFFAIFVPFVANTTALDRQWPAGLREVLRSSHESVQAAIPKGKSTLKLTVATDVSADQQQTEVSRKQVDILGYHYDEITVNGKLLLKNYKNKPVKMNVKKSLMGEVLETSSDGKVVKVAKNLAAVNPNSLIAWEFGLAPGAEKTLTYQYKVLTGYLHCRACKLGNSNVYTA